MKHTYKLLLIVAAITFIAACKKSGSSPSNPIVGKWTVVSDTARIYQGGTLSQVLPDSLIGTNFILFNSNGTGSETESDVSSTFKWSVSGSTLTVISDAQTIEGIQVPSTTTTSVIKTLTAHTLYFYISETAIIDNVSVPETDAVHLTK